MFRRLWADLVPARNANADSHIEIEADPGGWACCRCGSANSRPSRRPGDEHA